MLSHLRDKRALLEYLDARIEDFSASPLRDEMRKQIESFGGRILEREYLEEDLQNLVDSEVALRDDDQLIRIAALATLLMLIPKP